MKQFEELAKILKTLKSAVCLLVVEDHLGILKIEPIILSGGPESESAELIGCLLDYTRGSIKTKTTEFLAKKQEGEKRSKKFSLEGLEIDLIEIPPGKIKH